MFEINLLSSDDGRQQNEQLIPQVAPEVVDLLSSSPVRGTPALTQPQHRQDCPPEPLVSTRGPSTAFELSSSPILPARDHELEVSALDVNVEPESMTFKAVSAPTEAATSNLHIAALPQVDPAQPAPLSPQTTKSSTGSQAPKRAFRSSTEVIATAKPNSHAKKFKAAKSNSAPPAVKLVTDRKKACTGIECHVWDISGDWTTLLKHSLEALEIDAPCRSEPTNADIEGVAAIVTVSGKYLDSWDAEQHVFVKTDEHEEFMDTQIVILLADQLDRLGNLDRPGRDAYFHRIENMIAGSNHCLSKVSPVYIVPEVHLQLRKMMAAYDRRLRQRVMDHSNGRDVTVEQPPQQHYFNDVQARLQVENQVRAVYPRTKADAADTMANWIIDLGFSRYRARTDATLEGIGGSVRSKTTSPEITAEALAVIHGLPPRIASSIAGDMKSLGKLCTLLTTNDKQQMARVRYYGKGDWNSSLITMLTSSDPNQTIGQA